jgi:uncharacterized metal-binding protein YceD (DUF177 family)
MVNPLLDRVPLAELANRVQLIEYKGNVGDFERLAGIVEADLAMLGKADRPREWRAAPVETRLEFAWVDARQTQAFAKGRIAARLAVVCQRCLAAFELPLETSFSILFQVPGEGASKLADLANFDVWELETDTVRPIDFVEELLIMALPLAPTHGADDTCHRLADSNADNIAGNSPEAVRPFADLKSQMEKLNK